MKWFALVGMAAAGAIAWQIGERLSSDAISMGLGVFFGVLAGVPTALLVMAADRRDDRPTQPQQPPQYQPPVIVITTNQPQALPEQRHHVIMPDAGFYEIQPEHSRELTRRRG